MIFEHKPVRYIVQVDALRPTFCIQIGNGNYAGDLEYNTLQQKFVYAAPGSRQNMSAEDLKEVAAKLDMLNAEPDLKTAFDIDLRTLPVLRVENSSGWVTYRVKATPHLGEPEYEQT